MKFRGKLLNVVKGWDSSKWQITFELHEGHIEDIEKIKNLEDIDIEAKKHTEKRSGRANRLLWACIADITYHLRQENKDPGLDKWDVYLGYIKRYGMCELIRIAPEHFSRFQETWRECEVIGHPVENGQERLDILCYYGSSTYNSKEFSTLLDDVIADMVAMGIPTPPSEEMRRAIAELEAQEIKKNGEAIN